MPHICLPEDTTDTTYNEDGDSIYPDRHEDCPLVTFADMIKETFPPVEKSAEAVPVPLPTKPYLEDKKVDFSKMSYSELCHFLENHPGKRG
jgi:hypothetical protein